MLSHTFSLFPLPLVSSFVATESMGIRNVHYPFPSVLVLLFLCLSHFYCKFIFGWFGVPLLSARVCLSFYAVYVETIIICVLSHCVCASAECVCVCVCVYNSHHFQSIRHHQRWRPLVAIARNVCARHCRRRRRNNNFMVLQICNKIQQKQQQTTKMTQPKWNGITRGDFVPSISPSSHTRRRI